MLELIILASFCKPGKPQVKSPLLTMFAFSPRSDNAGMSRKRSFMVRPCPVGLHPSLTPLRFARAVFCCPAEVGRRDVGQAPGRV